MYNIQHIRTLMKLEKLTCKLVTFLKNYFQFYLHGKSLFDLVILYKTIINIQTFYALAEKKV